MIFKTCVTQLCSYITAHAYLPFISVLTLIIFVTSNIIVYYNGELSVERSRDISFTQSLEQYFGMNSLHKTMEHGGMYTFLDKIIFWSSLIYVEAYHGHVMTLIILTLAYINFAATNYLRGTLTVFGCCSSYTFWTFIGAFVATILLHISIRFKRRYIRVLFVLVFCSVFILCAWTVEDKRMWHHTFPSLTGMIFVLLIHQHNQPSPIRYSSPRDIQDASV